MTTNTPTKQTNDKIFAAIRDLEALTKRAVPTVVAALRDAANHGGFKPDVLLRDIEALTRLITRTDLAAIIAALDAHDVEWAHRHISKRPNVPEALRKAIDSAR